MEYVNPDAPVLGEHKFIKYQYHEPDITQQQGYYYQGGGFDPFAQYYQPQPQSYETRRFMGPDVSQYQQSQQGFFPQQSIPTSVLNGFIDQRTQMNTPPLAPPQPQPTPFNGSPWQQPIAYGTVPVNTNQFMQPMYEDPYLSRPYGNYSDATQGMIVPPINRKEMWEPTHTPPPIYDSPVINWNAPSSSNGMGYTNPQIPPQPYHSPFQTAPSNEAPGSWFARAQENWK